jgi:hypothetical protein
MTAPRPTLEELASRFSELDSDRLELIVRVRLLGDSVRDELPRLGRDEDRTDVLIDLAEWLRDRNREWMQLLEVCARLADAWAGSEGSAVRDRPEPLGELHYLCARIGAVEARNGIARVVQREDLRGVLLPNGEDLQLRALRCLAGLLARVSGDEREEFLPLFSEAIAVPQHLPLALTALVAFDPERRDEYVERAGASWPLHLEQVLGRLERNVALLQAEMRLGPLAGPALRL